MSNQREAGSNEIFPEPGSGYFDGRSWINDRERERFLEEIFPRIKKWLKYVKEGGPKPQRVYLPELFEEMKRQYLVAARKCRFYEPELKRLYSLRNRFLNGQFNTDVDAQGNPVDPVDYRSWQLWKASPRGPRFPFDPKWMDSPRELFERKWDATTSQLEEFEGLQADVLYDAVEAKAIHWKQIKAEWGNALHEALNEMVKNPEENPFLGKKLHPVNRPAKNPDGVETFEARWRKPDEYFFSPPSAPRAGADRPVPVWKPSFGQVFIGGNILAMIIAIQPIESVKPVLGSILVLGFVLYMLVFAE